MVILTLEMLRGKPVSERAQTVATFIGLGLILALMLFVIGLDISKMDWFKKLFS
jgi:membrane-associated protease RseP (regulator of RpoE activity)